MKVGRLMLVSVAIGLSGGATADHRFRILSDELNRLSYVKVTEIRVNGEPAGSVEEVNVPDGADVTVVFGNGKGFIWGDDTAVYSNVVEDISISRLPESLVSYAGTATDPIQIGSVDDLMRLQRISEKSGLENVSIRQTADLDLADAGLWNGICSGVAFAGSYDGDNHRIDNVTLKNAVRGGFFFNVSKGTIKDLTVHFCGFENPNRLDCGGAIVANGLEDVHLIHLIAEGQMPGVTSPSAGIVVNASRGELTGCTNRIDFTGSFMHLGGLVSQCEYQWSGRYKGLILTDCANEGRLENRKIIGATGGLIGEISKNQQTVCRRCVSRGEIVSSQKGSLIGEFGSSANTMVSIFDCSGDADIPPIGVVKDGVCKINGLNFATVSSGVASFCSAPTGAGSFKVMLENADPIELSGVALGDRLILGDYEKYSGTVKCADPAFSVKGVDGIWTVLAAMSVDVGTIEEGPEAGVFELHPAENQISAHVEGFSGTCLKIPGSLEFIRGVECSKLVVANAGYDVTAAVAFDGDDENGYALTLDGSAVVNGVKVTPTIGEGVSDAFKVSAEPRIAIRSVPGLWYGLYRGSMPEVIDEVCEVKQAESEMISLVDNLPRMNGSFYRVKVSLANPVKN